MSRTQMNRPDARPLGRLVSLVRLFMCMVPARLQIGGLVLMIGAGLTEGISISLLGPLLVLIGDNPGGTGVAHGLTERMSHLFGVTPTLPLILVIFVAAMLCRAIFVRQRDLTIFRLHTGFTDALRQRLYRAIAEARWAFLAKERLSHLARALTADVGSVTQGILVLLHIPTLGLVAAVQFAIALRISPLLTFAVLACGGLAAIVMRWRGGDAYQLGERIAVARRATFDEISDFLASLKLAKSHNAEERHRLAFEGAVAQQRDHMLAVNRRLADTRLFISVATALVLCGFVYIGVVFLHLSMPDLLVMIVVFARLTPGLMQIQQNVDTLWQVLPTFDYLYRLMARCEAAKEPLVAGGTDRLVLRDRISLSGVSFRYDKEHGPDVLANLDLEIEAGLVVAVVGASGAGKSTLADLLMGLQVADAGSLAVDGQPLSGGRLAAWRRSIAYIPQENFLFNQSIRANLRWGAPDASDADLHHALALAGAGSFVAAMPEGLDTVVGERGSRLSGGERQRMILARALLRQPTLLILDEATSALDHDSEQAVWATIDRLRGSTTVIVIAHRLSTLRNADRIAVLDGGRIAEFGTWRELSSDANGRFAVLLRAGAIT